MMELGPKKHKKDGLLGPYSIRVVYTYIYIYIWTFWVFDFTKDEGEEYSQEHSDWFVVNPQTPNLLSP